MVGEESKLIKTNLCLTNLKRKRRTSCEEKKHRMTNNGKHKDLNDERIKTGNVQWRPIKTARMSNDELIKTRIIKNVDHQNNRKHPMTNETKHGTHPVTNETIQKYPVLNE